MNNITTLLKKHNYAIICEMTCDGYRLKIPRRIEKPEFCGINLITRVYDINQIEWSYYSLEDNTNPLFISNTTSPTYAIRQILLAKILFYCLGILYNPHYIIFIANDKETNIDEFFLKLPLSTSEQPDDITKDIALSEICTRFIVDRDFKTAESLAISKNVVEGFRLFHSVFQGD